MAETSIFRPRCHLSESGLTAGFRYKLSRRENEIADYLLLGLSPSKIASLITRKMSTRQRAGSSGAAGKKWLKSREVRKLLEISPGKLHAMRANMLISYMRIGGTIYYDSAEIEKMFEKAKSPAER